MAKILIVEDEPGIAFGLESDLQTEGYEVAVVGDGAEAVGIVTKGMPCGIMDDGGLNAWSSLRKYPD